jgi:hypothetical protein
MLAFALDKRGFGIPEDVLARMLKMDAPYPDWYAGRRDPGGCGRCERRRYNAKRKAARRGA